MRVLPGAGGIFFGSGKTVSLIVDAKDQVVESLVLPVGWLRGLLVVLVAEKDTATARDHCRLLNGVVVLLVGWPGWCKRAGMVEGRQRERARAEDREREMPSNILTAVSRMIGFGITVTSSKLAVNSSFWLFFDFCSFFR